jgi:hypothetical protein
MQRLTDPVVLVLVTGDFGCASVGVSRASHRVRCRLGWMFMVSFPMLSVCPSIRTCPALSARNGGVGRFNMGVGFDSRVYPTIPMSQNDVVVVAEDAFLAPQVTHSWALYRLPADTRSRDVEISRIGGFEDIAPW